MKITRQTRRKATQLFRGCLIHGLLNEDRARRGVQEIVAGRPRGYLATLSVFCSMVKLELARRSARVESARPLPPDLQTRVSIGLASLFGPGLTMSFVDNPALIGGMRIRVGSDVYDGSVKARLSGLEQSF